jgi:hypothetical protein
MSNSIFCPSAQQGAKANPRATYPAGRCKPGHLSNSFLQPPTQYSPTNIFVMIRAIVENPTPSRYHRVSPEWFQSPRFAAHGGRSPPDIVTTWHVSASSYRGTGPPHHDPFLQVTPNGTLTHVCRHWRGAALSHHSLCGSITPGLVARFGNQGSYGSLRNSAG